MPRGLALGMSECLALRHWECQNVWHCGIGLIILDTISDDSCYKFDGLGVASVMNVSSHLGCMCLCILVACIFASLEICDFLNGFAVIFKDQKMRASLHPGCSHFFMLFAGILCG